MRGGVCTFALTLRDPTDEIVARYRAEERPNTRTHTDAVASAAMNSIDSDNKAAAMDSARVVSPVSHRYTEYAVRSCAVLVAKLDSREE